MSDPEDIAARERQFEELLSAGRITPDGTAVAALADLGLRVRCAATRQDGTPCSWPPIDGTDHCTVHVGRDHHVRRSRAAEISSSAALWLLDVAREPPADLAQAVTWSVVLRHLEKRGVDHPLRSGEGGGQLSPKQRSSLERLVAELTQLIAGDVAPTPGSGGIHGIPPWVQAAASLALKNAESADTPFGQAFRRVVAGGPDDGDWKTLALDEFCSTIAGLYLERVYKTALQDELGWQAEASTRPDATERARRVVELLQRIAKGSSRGRKAESQEEVMRRVQEAVDRIKERGDKLNRYSIAAELWITPSGLDALMRRHDLRRTKDGRILCN